MRALAEPLLSGEIESSLRERKEKLRTGERHMPYGGLIYLDERQLVIKHSNGSSVEFLGRHVYFLVIYGTKDSITSNECRVSCRKVLALNLTNSRNMSMATTINQHGCMFMRGEFDMPRNITRREDSQAQTMLCTIAETLARALPE